MQRCEVPRPHFAPTVDVLYGSNRSSVGASSSFLQFFALAGLNVFVQWEVGFAVCCLAARAAKEIVRRSLTRVVPVLVDSGGTTVYRAETFAGR